jgi:hypothetical protein
MAQSQNEPFRRWGFRDLELAEDEPIDGRLEALPGSLVHLVFASNLPGVAGS